jgi:zinc/manganese transport system permease protein
VTDLLATLLWPAITLAAGAAVLAPLGVEVFRRGIVFVDLAIAQGAALAALLVQLRWHDAATPLAVMAAGALGALATAGLARLLEARLEHGREAAIGLLYVAGASAGLLVSAHDPHGTAHFTQLLAADVLWADRTQAAGLVAVASVVLALAARGTLAQRDGLFYGVLGLAVAPALMALGLYTVFALLIAPAFWAEASGQARGRPGRVLLFAVLTSLGALAISAVLDWPSGATVAALVALAGLVPTIRRHETRGKQGNRAEGETERRSRA